MKIRKLVGCSILLMSQCLKCALASDQQNGLKDPDPSVRRETWQQILENGPEKMPEILLPQLTIGLRDGDQIVRYDALSAAARIGFSGRQQQRFLLSENSEVAGELLELANADDPSIRKTAFRAIAFGVEPTKELEDKLLKRYRDEKDPSRRADLIGLLLMTSGKKWVLYGQREPTQFVTDLIATAVSDPNAVVRRAAVEAIGGLHRPPNEVLPKLAQGLDAPDPSIYIRALQRYGVAAQTYLPKLEEMRQKASIQNTQEGYSLRINLDTAIRLIRQPDNK